MVYCMVGMAKVHNETITNAEILQDYLTTVYVTEFWKITFMGTHETIRIADFTMVLWTAESTFQIFLKFFW